MPASVNAALRYIRALFAGQKAEGQSDQVLLEQFVCQRDESAFAALLQRHGPMAMGVCMRILHDEHLAEDAMQATFLVLAVKASRLRTPGSLAGWLYGVALRLARKLKAQVLRSQRQVDREKSEPPPATAEASRREEKALLDEELERLPDKYRLPLLLCYFEGRTHEEAAAQLGWTPGQVKGLLDRGRERLRFRLSRRGVTLSAAGLAMVLGETAWAATMISPRLAVPTVLAGMNLVSGKTLVECGVSASVVTLVKGGLSMYPKKMLLVLALLLFGVGAAIWASAAGGGPEQPVGQKKLEQGKEEIGPGLLVLNEKEAEKGKEKKKDDGDSAEEEAVIDRFIDILKNPSSPGRLAACEALGKRGTKAKRALPEMMKYLKESLEALDNNQFRDLSMVRWSILPATISIGGNGQETFDFLANALKTKAAVGINRDILIACLGRFAAGCDKAVKSKVRVELQVIAETEMLSDMAKKALIVAKGECLGEIQYNLFRDDRQGKPLKLSAGTPNKVEMLDGFTSNLTCQIDKDDAVRVGWTGGNQFPSPGIHFVIVWGKDGTTGYIKANVSHERDNNEEKRKK